MAVWEEFKEVALKYKCLSLGEGAPAYQPPQFLIDELIKAIGEGHNQYTRTFGNPILVNKIAEFYSSKFGGRKINPLTEVIVGAGAYNTINSILMGLVNPGEEVAVFEPCWPCYIDHIQYCGGVYRPIELKLTNGNWEFDPVMFEAALNEKTKIVIFNNA